MRQNRDIQVVDTYDLIPVVVGVFHQLQLAGGGGGVRRPQPITPEQIAVARRTRRQT